ncbi:MAG: 50S ribosomal protein L37e [Candidatus Hodarchaeales archaeon]|jgi:large subunit ribosomal protein L37e
MGKGTPSFGRRSGKKTHIMCRRCSHRSYHVQKKRCAYCGFGNSARLRKYNWTNKLFQNKRRKYA